MTSNVLEFKTKQTLEQTMTAYEAACRETAKATDELLVSAKQVAIAMYELNHKVWEQLADRAFPNRHLLVKGLDYQWKWYQEWLEKYPEPQRPYCYHCLEKMYFEKPFIRAFCNNPKCGREQ